jgi:ADP-ribose pyrophosphatase YjhB (NUDIX family)
MGHRLPRIRVAGMIWHEESLVLIRQGSDRSPRWMLPGGGVEGGESMVTALTRELREEIGLRSARVHDPVAMVESIAPEAHPSGRHLLHVIFQVSLPDGLEPGDLSCGDPDVRGIREFGRAELLQVPLHPPIAAWLSAWRSGTPFAYFGPLWAP